MKEYWFYFDEMPDKETIEQEKIENKIKEYYLDGCATDLWIYDEAINNSWSYYSRWWHLCETIQNKYLFDEESYQEYRKKS